MGAVGQDYFPSDVFDCYYEKGTTCPLVVSPRSQKIDLIGWARGNQQLVANAIKKFGAVVFSGFNITKETFPEVYTAVIGTPPEHYKGHVHRSEIIPKVYESTRVAKERTIPLHQEVSYGFRKDMPPFISFFCATPPEKGTGQTTVGDVRSISKKIQALMPDLWQRLTTKKLTYTNRYLPEDSWYGKWIRWLNPAHTTVEERFGSKVREKVEAKCKEEGLECEWDGGWVVTRRRGVPATIDYEGETLFCNQIHLDKFNSALCGGWIQYIFARILLYPRERSMQFDVEFVDGTPITRSEASALLTIVQEHQQGRNWKKGDALFVDNVSTAHGRTTHKSEREILVAMSGSVGDSK